MDGQGVEACVLFPTLAVCVEHFMQDDPTQLYANFDAFNRWLDEDWGYRRRRTASSPHRCCRCVDRRPRGRRARPRARARRACRLAAARAAPAAARRPIRTSIRSGRASTRPACSVGLHIGESGYNELFSTAWGEEANPSSHQQSAFQWTCFYGDRPIMETSPRWCCTTCSAASPTSGCVGVENGSLWVAYLAARRSTR